MDTQRQATNPPSSAVSSRQNSELILDSTADGVGSKRSSKRTSHPSLPLSANGTEGAFTVQNTASNSTRTAVVSAFVVQSPLLRTSHATPNRTTERAPSDRPADPLTPLFSSTPAPRQRSGGAEGTPEGQTYQTAEAEPVVAAEPEIQILSPDRKQVLWSSPLHQLLFSSPYAAGVLQATSSTAAADLVYEKNLTRVMVGAASYALFATILALLYCTGLLLQPYSTGISSAILLSIAIHSNGENIDRAKVITMMQNKRGEDSKLISKSIESTRNSYLRQVRRGLLTGLSNLGTLQYFVSYMLDKGVSFLGLEKVPLLGSGVVMPRILCVSIVIFMSFVLLSGTVFLVMNAVVIFFLVVSVHFVTFERLVQVAEFVWKGAVLSFMFCGLLFSFSADVLSVSGVVSESTMQLTQNSFVDGFAHHAFDQAFVQLAGIMNAKNVTVAAHELQAMIRPVLTNVSFSTFSSFNFWRGIVLNLTNILQWDSMLDAEGAWMGAGGGSGGGGLNATRSENRGNHSETLLSSSISKEAQTGHRPLLNTSDPPSSAQPREHRDQQRTESNTKTSAPSSSSSTSGSSSSETPHGVLSKEETTTSGLWSNLHALGLGDIYASTGGGGFDTRTVLQRLRAAVSVSTPVLEAIRDFAKKAVSISLIFFDSLYELMLFIFLVRYLLKLDHTVLYYIFVKSFSVIQQSSAQVRALRMEQTIKKRFSSLFFALWHVCWFNFSLTFVNFYLWSYPVPFLSATVAVFLILFQIVPKIVSPLTLAAVILLFDHSALSVELVVLWASVAVSISGDWLLQVKASKSVAPIVTIIDENNNGLSVRKNQKQQGKKKVKGSAPLKSSATKGVPQTPGASRAAEGTPSFATGDDGKGKFDVSPCIPKAPEQQKELQATVVGNTSNEAPDSTTLSSTTNLPEQSTDGPGTAPPRREEYFPPFLVATSIVLGVVSFGLRGVVLGPLIMILVGVTYDSIGSSSTPSSSSPSLGALPSHPPSAGLQELFTYGSPSASPRLAFNIVHGVSQFPINPPTTSPTTNEVGAIRGPSSTSNVMPFGSLRTPLHRSSTIYEQQGYTLEK